MNMTKSIIEIDGRDWTLANLAHDIERQRMTHVKAEDALAAVQEAWELCAGAGDSLVTTELAVLYSFFGRKLRKASTVCGWLNRAVSTDDTRYYLTHIYQRDGFAYATDGHLLFWVPVSLLPNPDPDYEGYLDSQGAPINFSGRYPDVERLIKEAVERAEPKDLLMSDLKIHTASDWSGTNLRGRDHDVIELDNGAGLNLDYVKDVVAGYPVLGVPFVKGAVTANTIRVHTTDDNPGGAIAFEMGDSGAGALIMALRRGNS